MLKDTQSYSTEIFNSGIKKRFCLIPTQCIALKHPMEKHAKNKETGYQQFGQEQLTVLRQLIDSKLVQSHFNEIIFAPTNNVALM